MAAMLDALAKNRVAGVMGLFRDFRQSRTGQVPHAATCQDRKPS
jgi:hypothetical protein